MKRISSFTPFHYKLVMSLFLRPALLYLSNTTPYGRITVRPIPDNIYKLTIPHHKKTFLTTKMIQTTDLHAHVTICGHTHTGINQAIIDLDGCQDELTPGRYEWLHDHGIVTLSDIVTYTEKHNTLHWMRHLPQWLHQLLPLYIPTDQTILRAGQF